MSSNPLTYLPAPRQGRRIGRWGIIVLLILGAGVAWQWKGELRTWGNIQYWQWQCARFQPWAGTVVASVGRASIAGPIPPCWTSLQRAALTPRPGPVYGPGFPQTIAFLHRLRSPAGNERIVAVRCIMLYLTSASVEQAMQPIVVAPASVWPLSRRPSIVWEAPFKGGYPMGSDVKVFAGQHDPADPAHFTISYSVRDKPGIIDGRLGDDDTITLRVREGSADVMHNR